jgi:hypothetical protein
MTFHASWKALFDSITTVSESGNRNVAGFTGAMDFEASLDVKMTRLDQPYGLLLAANDKKEVSILHHPHNFGGTLLRPTNKVGCLVGIGPSAVPIIVDHNGALRSIQAIVSPIEDIVGCPTGDNLTALLTPPVNGVGLVNLEALSCFFLAPFLCNVILASNSLSPLVLIIFARAAQEEHVREHKGEEDFGKGDVNAHVDLFSLWCIGVHQGQVDKMRFLIAPNDGKLADWSSHLHCENILPSIATASTHPLSSTDTADILRSLAAGISHTSKEAEHQNKLHRKQLNYIKAKDAKKKNKAEKWHPTSQRLVLNAASTDSDSPAEEIPASYLRIKNSETAGMANKELQSQMSELGHANVGFAHGLAASLYIGNILWNNGSTQSNLSPFTIFELDPLSMTQATCCLQLHLLLKNTEGKSLDKIKASQIQDVKVPTTFEELHQTLLFYSGITSILFRPRSVIIAGVKSFATAILLEKIIFKGRIAANSKLPAKILYAMEICIQRWLEECVKFEDWSMVNNRLVSFDEVFEMVMNSTMNITLPPNFIKPTHKISPAPNNVTPTGEDGKQKGGKKRKSGKVDRERITKNIAPV